MTATLDTNVLVRSLVLDDKDQAAIARRLLDAGEIVVSSSCLCELSWVLESVYQVGRDEIYEAIARLINARNVIADRDVAEAGLRVLQRGGEFSDGVLAAEGQRLGGDTFITFDRRAVKVLQDAGFEAEIAK